MPTVDMVSAEVSNWSIYYLWAQFLKLHHITYQASEEWCMRVRRCNWVKIAHWIIVKCILRFNAWKSHEETHANDQRVHVGHFLVDVDNWNWMSRLNELHYFIFELSWHCRDDPTSFRLIYMAEHCVMWKKLFEFQTIVNWLCFTTWWWSQSEKEKDFHMCHRT